MIANTGKSVCHSHTPQINVLCTGFGASKLLGSYLVVVHCKASPFVVAQTTRVSGTTAKDNMYSRPNGTVIDAFQMGRTIPK